ncbi:MAG: hypothetical protein JJT94_08765 [Bernardetiaceae bacterium]|nr:hypothetical protein [Bernardetiaceae bacterium]
MEQLEQSQSFEETLQLVIDGEATPAQEQSFHYFLNQSYQHSRSYEETLNLKQLVAKRVKCECAPSELVQNIQSSIKIQSREFV